ncbi:hypothetical protein MHD_06990 [Mannheimia granulomatis]|uniref:2-acyl-glycerophospho-ethanolamine acyltransferase n=1 Tax=Mannheimia granulomatis TaxID=85402 RepID=A0A011NE70_9PAST|nr:hypothetical protein [Mannheimia granulomatis]EXI62857.1 2-acyl-glycerophospho-ethanolamine acyltransferase [Mannheimia granulomatis]RGE48220.1 hypothetical protein MHD_06990 [Mannheimia granulomatis]
MSILFGTSTFFCLYVRNKKLHPLILDLEEIKEKIKFSGLPPIMQPSEIFIVKEIPLLGAGKVDFKGAKILAQQLSI